MSTITFMSKRAPVAFKMHVGSILDPGKPLRLLWATDLWARSDQALQRTLSLAEASDAELQLLHVVDGDAPLRLIGRRAELARSALEWRLRHWPFARGRSRVSVRIGNPHRTITRVAREWRADLVVLGAYRSRPVDRLLGTTAERLALAARCAVLVVNRDGPDAYANAAVVASSCCGTATLVDEAMEWKILESAQLQRHVYSSDRGIARWMRRFGGGRPNAPNCGAASRVPDTFAAIRAALANTKPDLVICQIDQNPAAARLAGRNFADALLRTCSADVLISPRRMAGAYGAAGSCTYSHTRAAA